MKSNKEILILLKAIHDNQIEENKSDRLRELERTVEILKGNLEVKEERIRAMERFLGVELVSEYKKK